MWLGWGPLYVRRNCIVDLKTTALVSAHYTRSSTAGGAAHAIKPCPLHQKWPWHGPISTILSPRPFCDPGTMQRLPGTLDTSKKIGSGVGVLQLMGAIPNS